MISIVMTLLMVVGLVSSLGLLVFMLAGVLPNSVSMPIAKKCLQKGVGLLGGQVALLEEEDGRLTIAPAEWDGENGVYWVSYGEEDIGIPASGNGGAPKPFCGGEAILAYAGYGAAGSIVSAKVGQRAKEKFTQNSQNAHKATSQPAIPDGGNELGETQIMLPENSTVQDLRSFLNFAPYNIQPHVFKRVEKNAKTSMQKFGDWGTIAQVGGMLGAFFIGSLMTWFVMDGSGGDGESNGGGDVVPMMIDVMTSGVLT